MEICFDHISVICDGIVIIENSLNQSKPSRQDLLQCFMRPGAASYSRITAERMYDLFCVELITRQRLICSVSKSEKVKK